MCITLNTQADVDRWVENPRDFCVHVEGKGLVFRHIPSDDKQRVPQIYGAGSASFYGEGQVDVWETCTRVTAYGKVKVHARAGLIHAYAQSSVEVSGSPTIEASPSVDITVQSGSPKITGGHILRKTDTLKYGVDVLEWAKYYGVEVEGEGPEALLTVYKCVDSEYLSQYQRYSGSGVGRTSYAPGTSPEASDWNDWKGCGNGLHFSPTPFMAGEYVPDYNVSREDRRYLRVQVRASESVTLGDKIKSRRVIGPCEEVDFGGRPAPIEAEIVKDSTPVPSRVTVSLLEKARAVPLYQGKPNARGIQRELGVSRLVATDLAYRLRSGS